MRVVRSPRRLRAVVDHWRAAGERVGFVPTMGALHAGHASLLHRARRECDRVVMSRFVNPLQFGAGEDYARYPRTAARDLRVARDARVDVVYAPAAGTMYPPGSVSRVIVPGLREPLCGRCRPGHFDGVATVVAALLHTVDPDVLYLGQKDAQQAVLLRRMVHDLHFRARVRVLPIVRDAAGIALSSRNAYLTSRQRAQARLLSQALAAAREAAGQGERRAQALRRLMRRVLARGPDVRVDYAEVVDPETLRPVRRLRGEALAAVAVRIGRARLIDNAAIRPGRLR